MNANRDTSIRIDDLSFAYAREPVLKDVSFQLEKAAVGLLGPNGSGKTTLLRVLLGQVPVPAGRVKVLGFDMHTQARRARGRLAACRSAAA
jgi:ABC-type multidrug transport system ATPase subunit